MAAIRSITSRQILDSRGESTIETTVCLDNSTQATASVPSGASTGKFEAKIAVDSQDDSKDAGITRAIKNMEEIEGELKGLDPTLQSDIDNKILSLDGTSTKARLGANTTLSVSLAVARAGAKVQDIPLWQHIARLYGRAPHTFPTPMFNFIEGGKHADNLLEFQEFLLIPGTEFNYPHQLQIATKLYQRLKIHLHTKNASTLVADEGGFAPELSTNEKALSILKGIVEDSEYSFAQDVFLGIDAAASSFQKGEKYDVDQLGGKVSAKDLINFYTKLAKEFQLLYIEDPLGEEDIKGWKEVMKKLGDRTQIVGDDLTTTNPYRLQMALGENLTNSIIIKPNQIGTLTQTLAVAEMARHSGLKITVSHRSGETEDTSIADIAVGIGADQVKFGAPARERVLKYNRLTRIYQDIGD